MESLIFAAVIGLTVYLFLRRMRLLKAQRAQKARQLEADAAPVEEEQTMPRLGTPGTITRDQVKALKANDFEPSRLWSKEEAKLILDTVTYLRAAIYKETGETDAPIEVQNGVLKFILADAELRNYVYEWGLNRTREELETPQPVLDEDAEYARIAEHIRAQWESS